MQDEYQSIAKGVLVFPFTDELQPEAGPSVLPSPLKQLYDESYERYEAVYREFEARQTADQMEDVADWLDQCSQSPLLAPGFPLHRLPLAILQNSSESLAQVIPQASRISCSISGRDCPDLTSAMRAIAAGFLGETMLATKRSGRSGIEEVERWWSSRKDRSPLLLHIEQVQLIPMTVLSELIHILSVHRDLPARLLLSVPSTAHFLSSLTLIDQSAVDITIIRPRSRRMTGTALDAILEEATDSVAGVLVASADLAEEIRGLVERTGSGPQIALKALKWSLLRHSVASPLRVLADQPDSVGRVKAVLGGEAGAEARALLEIPLYEDLVSVLDPAPRISIMHALTRPADFVPPEQPVQPSNVDGVQQPGGSTSADDPQPEPPVSPIARTRGAASTSSPSRKRRKRDASPTPLPDSGEAVDATVQAGEGVDASKPKAEFKELEMLFNLWMSAGRSVNLWDWLEAFRSGMLLPHKSDADLSAAQDRGQPAAHSVGNSRSEDEDPSADPADNDHVDGADGGEAGGDHQEDEEEMARLHAIFIRFCEEARMLGLVRARGKGIGRRADEVVKGVGFI